MEWRYESVKMVPLAWAREPPFPFPSRSLARSFVSLRWSRAKVVPPPTHQGQAVSERGMDSACFGFALTFADCTKENSPKHVDDFRNSLAATPTSER
jgi:hypothetical protein